MKKTPEFDGPRYPDDDCEPSGALIVYVLGAMALFVGVALMVMFPEIPAAVCRVALRVFPW